MPRVQRSRVLCNDLSLRLGSTRSHLQFFDPVFDPVVLSEGLTLALQRYEPPHILFVPFCQVVFPDPDPPVAEFAGDARRWACRRTVVLQTPTNKADPVKSASPKDQKNEDKNGCAYSQARRRGSTGTLSISRCNSVKNNSIFFFWRWIWAGPSQSHCGQTQAVSCSVRSHHHTVFGPSRWRAKFLTLRASYSG